MKRIPLVVAAAAAAISCTAAPMAHATTALDPAAVSHGSSTHHRGLGFDVAGAKAHEAKLAHLGARTYGAPKAVHSHQAVPASYSLQKYALPAGDQGQVGSCVTWATGYTGYGILMNEQGINGGPMAPMFIYSQIAQGDDEGTWASVALPMEQKQGIDTKSDYFQGDFDYTTQPTQAERANAANYKISGFTDLTNSSDRKGAIEKAISSGLPVAIGFTARESIYDLNGSNYNYNPPLSEKVIGGHEVTIVGYDENGVTIENSWSSTWGKNGYFTAPWSWIKGHDVNEINSIGKLVPTS